MQSYGETRETSMISGTFSLMFCLDKLLLKKNADALEIFELLEL